MLARERKRFGERFYANLFAIAPEIEAQFARTPPELQDRMFVDMLFLVVRSLSRLDEFAPALPPRRSARVTSHTEPSRRSSRWRNARRSPRCANCWATR